MHLVIWLGVRLFGIEALNEHGAIEIVAVLGDWLRNGKIISCARPLYVIHETLVDAIMRRSL